jgi:putative copper export protein
MTMPWFYVGVLWVHVFCMTFWLGSAIFGTVLGGQARMQEAMKAHPLTRPFVPRLFVVFPVAIVTGVVTGVLLGTVMGPIRAVSDLVTTPYGITVSVAFILVVVAVIGGPAAPPPLKRLGLSRPLVGEACLVGAFTCMMLLRVGL